MEKAFTIGLCVTLVSLAPLATAQDIPACDKNHFILDEPFGCGTPALHASIGAPSSVAVDTRGNVYFSSPNVVFMLDPDGFVRRIAGDGSPGFSGDGGPATEARLSFPETYPELAADPLDNGELIGPLALDAAGNLFIADAYNDRIRKIDAAGVITTVAGLPKGRYPSSGLGPTGQAADLSLWWPQGIAVGPQGNLMIADGFGNLFSVAVDGAVTQWASGNCGPTFRQPGLCVPEGLAIDAKGSVFVADGYCRVRKATSPGHMATVVGRDRQTSRYAAYSCGYSDVGRSSEGGPAGEAGLSGPFALAVDATGQLFIADTDDGCILKVDAQGIITTVAGLCGHQVTPRRVPGDLGDGGLATDAFLLRPHGVAVDAAGNLYIADTGNFRIRRVNPDGVIETIAGNGGSAATKEAFVP